MYIQKVFEFYDVKNSSSVFLHGPDRAEPAKILGLYIEWYNKDFAPVESLPSIKESDFKFQESFCPIDFIDDYESKYKRFLND